MNAVRYEVSDRVATLTLNRPEALNAVNPDMIEALLESSARAAGDSAVRVVVVRGAGPHFMAGGDLKWFRQQTELDAPDRRARFDKLIRGVHASILNFRSMDKPVVAAVHGAVAGFGLSLMMAADLVVASSDAYFTMAYSNIALSPDGGATWSLPRQVGLKQAMEIALLGDRFDVTRARELGLVNRVVSPERLDNEAGELALRLAAGATDALARTKHLLNRSFDRTLEEQLDAEQSAFADCAAHADFVEGLAGFFEKRKPVFGKR
jgi:2-(1,2-epoxy-1,2-dihydrophenyl)acetyl-CoA isomerase